MVIDAPNNHELASLNGSVPEPENGPGTDRVTYSQTQIGQYFDRIKLPASARAFDVTELNGSQKLSYLGLLLKHQLTAIPFESLTLHYSTHRVININPQHVFKKIVLQPGRGGYCMENNTLFHVVLLSLGFDVYFAGARVFDSGKYLGLVHCLNIVTIDGDAYTVDVGFGPNEPVTPLKLVDRVIYPHIEPASVRFRRDTIPQNLNQLQKLWIYELREREGAAWVPMYSFSEMEFCRRISSS